MLFAGARDAALSRSVVPQPGPSSTCTLLDWKKGVQFIWGCKDDVFTEAWGRKWAGQMNVRFDGLDAGHFPQNTHGPKLVELLLEATG